jgi:hypothetical protein
MLRGATTASPIDELWVQELFRSQYPAAAGKTVWHRVASGAPSKVSAAARQTA